MKSVDQFQDELKAVLSVSRQASSLSLDTAMQACWLKMVAGFDELLCLPAVNIQQLPYQMQTAKKVLKRMKDRAILACCHVHLWQARAAFPIRQPYFDKNV